MSGPLRTILRMPLLMAVLSFSPAAFAHHTAATARISQRSTRFSLWTGTEQLSLSPQISYDFALFDRYLQGSSAYDDAPALTVFVHETAASLTLSLPSRTSFSVRVPLVGVLSESEMGNASAFGLGDIFVQATQGVPLAARLRLDASLGLRLPTGRYDAVQSLSLLDIRAGDNGAIDVRTYNTDIGLGGGATSLTAGLRLSLAATRSLTLGFSIDAQLPMHRTPDRIRFGADVSTGIEALTVLGERVRLGTTIEWRSHLNDDVLVDPSNSDTPEPLSGAHSGGRQSLRLRASLDVKLSETIGCGVRADVPVWQWTAGVQLAERLTVGATCGGTFSLQ